MAGSDANWKPKNEAGSPSVRSDGDSPSDERSTCEAPDGGTARVPMMPWRISLELSQGLLGSDVCVTKSQLWPISLAGAGPAQIVYPARRCMTESSEKEFATYTHDVCDNDRIEQILQERVSPAFSVCYWGVGR